MTVVYTLEIPAAELKAGHIMVNCGRALYLGEKSGRMLGYDQWPYVHYDNDGTVAGRGTVNVRCDSRVRIVAVHVDGSFITP
jgi:hypothetical protein